ncbi:hypothetical protein AG0111_0g1154 [Alternaria gaisen]|uniref:SMP domain-containing protein n=2 Tax=Alternaria sect. Alternaria TaxID=2499237 RepID=A0AB37WGM1_9PLEO|nr:hypothetical protein AG0111_0g1154 [Alternaria gaisen]RYN25144.1 hypothetical protein AA0115_g7906 [Alternaria tenuissima]
MSAPNANNPNEGIIGQAVNSVKNAANYVSETVQGQSAEASKEGNKQQAKGNVPGQDSLTDRASGALNAAALVRHFSSIQNDTTMDYER